MAAQPHHELKERTFLTAEGQAVPAGHPEAKVLLGPAGRLIPQAQAVALGLIGDSTGNYPKHLGGGWYELSTGERIQGKDDAAAAEKALHGATEDKALHTEQEDK